MIILKSIRTNVLVRRISSPFLWGKHREITSFILLLIEVINMSWDFGEVAGSMVKLCISFCSHKNLSGL